MKTKQIVGMIVAALLFVGGCAAGVIANRLPAPPVPEMTGELANSLLSNTGYKLSGPPMGENIAVIDVTGTIVDVGSSSIFSTLVYDHQRTLDTIDQLIDSSSNKGLLLFVNSPGGGVYESDELYLKLMEYHELTGRPIWTYMGAQATSGGYYIAMASEKICANRNTWTGSIGVIMSFSNYKELMDKVGIKTLLFTSGPNKAMGNPDIDVTDEQREIFQSLVDESYDQFLDIISKGRDIPTATLRPIADGRIYTAKQALELNLIDSIQTYDETVDQFNESLGGGLEIYIPSPTSIYSALGLSGKAQSRTDLEVLDEYLKTEGSGVPMYYADSAIR